jgi:RNA polymerase sigma-70 factor (ECF subfamily)
MQGGGAPQHRERPTERPIVYCLVPRDLAPRLHDLLHKHFRADAAVEVVVERRAHERRVAPDRRAGASRRIHERRAALVPVAAPELPRRARAYAAQLTFAQRVEPATLAREDQDTARLVARIQAGDNDAFALLYTRYFDRVYSYLRILLADHHAAEDAAQQVFVQLMQALPSYERRRQPFRAWLFVVVRNYALNQLRQRNRLEIVDPEQLDRRRERAAPDEEPAFDVVDWISDRELLLFVERLPPVQRQVLLMRYMLQLDNAEIAAVLRRKPAEIKVLHYRALRFLRDRLTAVGRTPRDIDRAGVQRRFRQAGVLRARRYALTP